MAHQLSNMIVMLTNSEYGMSHQPGNVVSDQQYSILHQPGNMVYHIKQAIWCVTVTNQCDILYHSWNTGVYV